VPQIEAVLERASAIARGDPGKGTAARVLAANVDTVFVVHPIAAPPNLRRIERELALAWDSGAVPVVVLTKADLSADPAAARAAVETVAFGVDVLLTSALAGEGVAPLLAYLAGQRTAVLIGPSGAGKSTLANALLGEQRQATREVRLSDGRGRHQTVARELLLLPGGGLLIDTPGLRSLGLAGAEEGIASTFPEIGQLAPSCRFGDCTHESEPGCAVRAAVEAGELPAERLASYHKLVRESQVAAMKTDLRLRAEEQRKWKTIHKAAREFFKITGREYNGALWVGTRPAASAGGRSRADLGPCGALADGAGPVPTIWPALAVSPSRLARDATCPPQPLGRASFLSFLSPQAKNLFVVALGEPTTRCGGGDSSGCGPQNGRQRGPWRTGQAPSLRLLGASA
jgi:ribosome biogenesis GTPase / thiamine phosphate phosphatase